MSYHAYNTPQSRRNARENDFLNIFQLFKKYHEFDTTFSFRGAFSEQFTGTILEISEGAASRTAGYLNKKVSFLLVESFQNVIKHGETLEQDHVEDYGIFSFRLREDGFSINSINHLKNDEVEGLRSWVDEVNSCDADSLKELYMKHLQNNELSTKSGAGLGLIELARKSGQKLKYEFDQQNGLYSRFHQQVSFCPSKEHAITPDNFISDTKSLYQIMAEQNAVILYKGDFSQKSILPLLTMVEQHSGQGVSSAQTRKVAHILIELLQNISKHALSDERSRKEGIFMIGNDGSETFIQCVNSISHEDQKLVDTNLRYLTSLNEDELADLHKTAMKASLKFENKYKSGLGLIEVVKAAKLGVNFTFEPINAETFLFAIKVSF